MFPSHLVLNSHLPCLFVIDCRIFHAIMYIYMQILTLAHSNTVPIPVSIAMHWRHFEHAYVCMGSVWLRYDLSTLNCSHSYNSHLSNVIRTSIIICQIWDHEFNLISSPTKRFVAYIPPQRNRTDVRHRRQTLLTLMHLRMATQRDNAGTLWCY